MLSMYSFISTFLDLVKAILVHCAHRLLSESTLILCTGTRPVEGNRPAKSPGFEAFQSRRYFLSELRFLTNPRIETNSEGIRTARSRARHTSNSTWTRVT